MIVRRVGLLFLLLQIAACQSESAATLVVTELRVYLPLPGSNAAVAYLTLENTSDAPVHIESVSSPQFAMVGVHETTITNGVARMQEIRKLTIAPQVSVGFEEGGLHLMLMNPHVPLTDNAAVTLEFRYDQEGLLIINTAARTRLAAD